MQSFDWYSDNPAPVHATRVGTDGGATTCPGCERASWGIAFDTGDVFGGPVPGVHQTAQRGEVFALLQALRRAPQALEVVTDSR